MLPEWFPKMNEENLGMYNLFFGPTKHCSDITATVRPNPTFQIFFFLYCLYLLSLSTTPPSLFTLPAISPTSLFSHSFLVISLSSYFPV